MNGKLIKITAADGTIYATKSDDIQAGCETIEFASQSSGQWKEYMAGRKEWSVNTNYLVALGKIKTDLLKIGSTVAITIGDGTASLSGNAIITTSHITASNGSLASGSFSFKGTGPLT